MQHYSITLLKSTEVSEKSSGGKPEKRSTREVNAYSLRGEFNGEIISQVAARFQVVSDPRLVSGRGPDRTQSLQSECGCVRFWKAGNRAYTFNGHMKLFPNNRVQ